MRLSTLQHTDLHLARISGGSVEDHGDHLVVRTPGNPGYYHGNALILGDPPEPAALARWRRRSDEVFGADHTCLGWSGDAPDEALLAAAVAAGFERDDAVAMELTEVRDVRPVVEVRPLRDLERAFALNRRCDPTERLGPPAYRQFKERLRTSWRQWIEGGHATWWGAFDGEALVGACGLVPVDGIGRFQAVETDPDARGRGVASSLVAHVARHALANGCERVVLAAEPDGPALGLYARIGFRVAGYERALLATPESLQIRPEDPSDRAGVRALVAAAFGRAGEADLVDRLRGQPGVLTRVAVRHGQILGHVLFSPVAVASGGAAVALGPVAVRPDHQRQGIGDALIRAGLEACRAAGHDVCFVLGGPDYYGRFGFRAAPPLGLRCTWPVPEPVFQVLELRPGALAGYRGTVRYHAAFDAV